MSPFTDVVKNSRSEFVIVEHKCEVETCILFFTPFPALLIVPVSSFRHRARADKKEFDRPSNRNLAYLEKEKEKSKKQKQVSPVIPPY